MGPAHLMQERASRRVAMLRGLNSHHVEAGAADFLSRSDLPVSGRSTGTLNGNYVLAFMSGPLKTQPSWHAVRRVDQNS